MTNSLRILPSVALAIAALLSASCAEDFGVYADVRYQLLCPSGVSGCGGSGEKFDLNRFDGQENNQGTGTANISCEVSRAGENNVLRTTVENGTGQLFGITGLVISSSGGGAIGGTCVVTVVEDGNTYSGGCSAAAPSEEFPCQVSGVEFGENEDFGKYVSFSLSCDGITSSVDPLRFRRNLRHINGTGEGAPITLANCTGGVLDN